MHKKLRVGRPPILLLLVGIFLFFEGCNGKKGNDQETGEGDQISTRLIGLRYLEGNELDKAEAAFKKMKEVNPDDPMSFANLGLVYLRKGNYQKAEKELKEALSMDPENPEIRLILAEVYQQNNQYDEAITVLKEIINNSSQNAQAFYKLAGVYEKVNTSDSGMGRLEALKKVVRLTPANIVPRLELIEMMAQKEPADSSLKHMEKLREIVPVFPRDAEKNYNRAVSLLQQNKTGDALPHIRKFHQYMKVTASYASGIREIGGPHGETTGNPIFTTDRYRSRSLPQGKSIMDIMEFTDATEATGLQIENIGSVESSLLAITDYDGDGDIDLYFSYVPEGASSSKFYLFNNEMGSFTDAKSSAGLEHEGKEQTATFADYNNDGNMDLFISMEEGAVLYRNRGNGSFDEVSGDAGLKDAAGANKALFADLDHEGDMDLYLAKNNTNNFYRNNSDGSFSPKGAPSGLEGKNLNSLDVDFGDLDDDGDLDLLVANKNGGSYLFSNQRRSNFDEVSASAGLRDKGNSASAIGDYNNDGLLDIFLTGNKAGDQSELYQNQGEGSFSRALNIGVVFDVLESVNAYDTEFLDFDNDGWLDLLVTGIPDNSQGRGIFLFHNDTTGGYADVSNLLPQNITKGFDASIADFNSDGDQDLIFATPQGIQLVRNETGNMNHYIQVQLVGLTHGNSKNNRQGIGARVALRAGGLYQMKTVTEPVVHFGLGNREEVDVMRIIWPNGVPQNIEAPQSKDDFVEEQMLKGSCPFLFTWNGEEYAFQKDMMWRSALGMPLAINGEDTTYAFPNISKEYIKIPGEHLEPKNGSYNLKITEELWETVYFDKASLYAVDHPDSVDIYVDEKFVMPPFPGRDIYQVANKHLPVSARNGKGHNLLPELSRYDFRYASDFKLGKYQGLTEPHDLILDLGEKARHRDSLYLFLRGWVFPTDASINMAMAQTDEYQLQQPSLQVINKQGKWETVIENLGYPMGKDKMVITDLSGKFLSDDRRARITTNMQIYWDHAFFATGRETGRVDVQELKMTKANLNYRGYSAMYRKGSRHGPHWFDYQKVTKGQKWRDLTGYYTRYGDVMPLLKEGDNQYIIANSGDEVSLSFDANGLEKLPKNWQRDFLIYSEGWVKDGDKNTAHGQQVKPLPFRGMPAYPYGKDTAYPMEENKQYYQKYNTRKVDTEGFKSALNPDL